MDEIIYRLTVFNILECKLLDSNAMWGPQSKLSEGEEGNSVTNPIRHIRQQAPAGEQIAIKTLFFVAGGKSHPMRWRSLSCLISPSTDIWRSLSVSIEKNGLLVRLYWNISSVGKNNVSEGQIGTFWEVFTLMFGRYFE